MIYDSKKLKIQEIGTLLVRIMVAIGCSLLLSPSLTGQNQETFQYLKNRVGQVNISYMTLQNGQRNNLTNPAKNVINLSEEQTFLVIRFDNLRLGLDPASLSIKSARDKENFYLSLPANPEYITENVAGLTLKEISNDGRLSDVASNNVNKYLEVKYLVDNKGLDTISSEIQLKFEVDAFPEKNPIRPSDKGGRLLKVKVRIAPSNATIRIKEANDLFTRLSDSTLSTGDQVNLYNQYLNLYSDLAPDRTKILIRRMEELSSEKEPDRTESEIYLEAKKAFDSGARERALRLVQVYHQGLEKNPDFKGDYLADILYYGVRSTQDVSVRTQWQEELLFLFPNSRPAKLLRSEQRTLRTSPNHSSIDNQHIDDTSGIFADSLQHDTLQSLISTIVSVEDEEDYGKIVLDLEASEILLTTADFSRSYILKFINAKTRQLVANPSFKGENKEFFLDELDLTNGDYEVFLVNDRGHQLANDKFTYRNRSLSAEGRYLLGLSSILLIYLIYHRFFKL